MAIDRLLAVVPVSDVAVAADWYERMLGVVPRNRPMHTLVEWQVTDSGWVQVFHDVERAGAGLLSLSVDDLDGQVAALSARGFEPGPVVEADKGVRLSSLVDPDGNRITFIGDFREDY